MAVDMIERDRFRPDLKRCWSEDDDLACPMTPPYVFATQHRGGALLAATDR